MTAESSSPRASSYGPSSIWAVGRNYAAHAKELKNEIPTEPLIFLKSGGCFFESKEVPLPTFSQDLHHELEIGIEFGLPSTHVRTQTPTDEGSGRFGEPLVPVSLRLCLDMTARDLQEKAKSKAQPWTLAKSFTAACPAGPRIPFSGFDDFQAIAFELKINRESRQRGQTSDMIFSLTQLISYVLARFPVQAGDLLLTGTPSGVARVVSGDQAEATWNLRGKPLTPPVHWNFV